MSEHTLTVNRASLLELIREKRNELDVETDERIAELQERIASSKSERAWADWYQEQVDRLRDGTLVVDVRSNGNRNFVPTAGTQPISLRPDQLDVETLRAQIEEAEGQLRYQTKRLEAALKLLEIATEETVTIPVSQYEELLR